MIRANSRGKVKVSICGWIYSSPLILILGQSIRFFPLTLLALWIFLQATPRQYDDMTATDGLSFWQALWHVHLPINGPALFLSWTLVLVWCLGELDTSIIVCPPGTTTLPIRIFTMMHYGVYSEVATACLLLAGTIFFVACLGLIVGQSQANYKSLHGAETQAGTDER